MVKVGKMLGMKMEEVDLDEGKILVADPKTQKVIKIDEKDWPEYEKRGYVQAEGNDLMDAVLEQLAKIRGNTPGAEGRRGAVEDDIERAEKKGDKKEVEKLKEADLDEGKMKDVMMDAEDMMYDGKSDDEIMKATQLSPKDIKTIRKKLPQESVDLDEKAEEVEEGYKPVKDDHYDVKVTVSDREVDKVKSYIMDSSEYNNGDIEDVDSDQVDGGGQAFKGKGDIFIQGDGAGSLGVDLQKEFGRKIKVMGESLLENDDKKMLSAGKMSQLHQMIKDKKSPEEIAKMMKLDVKTVKSLMANYMSMGYSESAASDARKAMSKDKDFSRRDSADDDTDATDADIKGASKNIIMQLRKAGNRASRGVEFADGKKVQIPAKMALAVQQKYNSLKRPADKEKFQAQIAKSYKDMLNTLKAGYGEQKESILDRMNRKIKENKNG